MYKLAGVDILRFHAHPYIEICEYTYVCIHIYIYICIHMPTYLCTYVHAYVYAYIYIYKYVSMYMHIHTIRDIRMQASIHTGMMYVYMCIYTYTRLQLGTIRALPEARLRPPPGHAASSPSAQSRRQRKGLCASGPKQRLTWATGLRAMLCQGLPFWQFKGAFQVSSGTVKWYGAVVVLTLIILARKVAHMGLVGDGVKMYICIYLYVCTCVYVDIYSTFMDDCGCDICMRL